MKLFFIILISSKVLLHSHYLSISFGRSKKVGPTYIDKCLFLIAAIEKKRMWKCSITEKLGWKKFVKIVRNKPFIKKCGKKICVEKGL